MTRPGRQRKDAGPDRLRVLMDGIEAGWLHRDKNVVTLVYDEEYRRSPLSTPLSVTLPLTQREHSGPG